MWPFIGNNPPQTRGSRQVSGMYEHLQNDCKRALCMKVYIHVCTVYVTNICFSGMSVDVYVRTDDVHAYLQYASCRLAILPVDSVSGSEVRVWPTTAQNDAHFSSLLCPWLQLAARTCEEAEEKQRVASSAPWPVGKRLNGE